MKPKPNRPSMKQVAKTYRKNVKKTSTTNSVQNYQGVAGQNPKMDRLVQTRMGKKLEPGTGYSYTGPVKTTKVKLKYKPAKRSMTYGSQVKTKTGYKGSTRYK